MRGGVPGQHDHLAQSLTSPSFWVVLGLLVSHFGSCRARFRPPACPGLEVLPPVVAVRGAPLELVVRVASLVV